MNNTQVLYVKVALYFILIYFLTHFILLGDEINYTKSILLAVVGGIVSSIIVVRLNLNHIRKLINGAISDKDLEVNQTAEFTIEDNADGVIEKVKEKLLSEKWTLLEENPANGYLRFRTKVNIRSWAEIVTIRVTENQEGKSTVETQSIPYLKTSLLDMGKNLQNVKFVESLVKAV